MSDEKQETMDAENCIDFDELLPLIGEFGYYQKRLLLYFLPSVFLWSFIYLGQIFLILVPPDHWCKIPELESLPKDEQLKLGIPKESDNIFNRCAMYNVNYSQVLEANITTANESWPQIACQAWVYDRNQVPYETIATEYNWVCKDDDLGPFTVTIYFIGCIIGGVIFGYVSDHWGRIPAVMLSNICGLIGGVLSTICKSFLWFSVTRFVAGMANDNCCNPLLILVLEYVGPKYRKFVTNFSLAVVFTLGICVLPWIAYFSRDWRQLGLAIALPIVSTLCMYFFISESVRWLISVGKIDKAMRIIKDIAKKNGKTVPDDKLIAFQKCCELKFIEQRSKNKEYTIVDLCKRWHLCRLTLCLIAVWMITALVYDAHVRAIIKIGPDVFFTFSVASLVELPAGLVPMFFLDATGRKRMTFGAFVLCAVGSFVAAALKDKLHIAISALFARFAAVIVYNVGLQWAAEILPTVVRGQSVSLIHIMGFVAALLSPFVVYAERYYLPLPMIILGGLSVFAAVLVLFLPETNNVEMPNTLSQAEFLWDQQRGLTF